MLRNLHRDERYFETSLFCFEHRQDRKHTFPIEYPLRGAIDVDDESYDDEAPLTIRIEHLRTSLYVYFFKDGREMQLSEEQSVCVIYEASDWERETDGTMIAAIAWPSSDSYPQVLNLHVRPYLWVSSLSDLLPHFWIASRHWALSAS